MTVRWAVPSNSLRSKYFTLVKAFTFISKFCWYHNKLLSGEENCKTVQIHGYGHLPWRIFSYYWELTALIQKVKQCTCKAFFLFPSHFKMAALCGFFTVTVKRLVWLSWYLESKYLKKSGVGYVRIILFPSRFKIVAVVWVFSLLRSNVFKNNSHETFGFLRYHYQTLLFLELF